MRTQKAPPGADGVRTRPAAQRPDAVPAADAFEQAEPVADDDAAFSPLPEVEREADEADALEQRQVVGSDQLRTPMPEREDGSEGDRLEQSVLEPVDEER